MNEAETCWECPVCKMMVGNEKPCAQCGIELLGLLNDAGSTPKYLWTRMDDRELNRRKNERRGQ